MSKDIALILHGWDYNADEVTVRKILGIDGRQKIQMRLDLGVLQMEITGRPDGRRPQGFDSLLDFQLDRLQRHRDQCGDDMEFALDNDECSGLKQEAMQYYYRYLSLFHLGEYEDVLRDTDHNLQLFDMIKQYAQEEIDRLGMEQFRPYVLMMNTRARACLSLEDRKFDQALNQIDEGIYQIEEFLREIEREELIENCREIVFLQEWSERIRTNRPLSREEQLRQELRSAVETENYERAAQIRDEIRSLV
jgi:hypothetical protein